MWKVPLQGLKSDLVLVSPRLGHACFGVRLVYPFGGGQRSLSTRCLASLLHYLCISLLEDVFQGAVSGTRETGSAKQTRIWEHHRSRIARSSLFCSPCGEVTELHLETGLGKGSSWGLRFHLAYYKQFQSYQRGQIYGRCCASIQIALITSERLCKKHGRENCDRKHH